MYTEVNTREYAYIVISIGKCISYYSVGIAYHKYYDGFILTIAGVQITYNRLDLPKGIGILQGPKDYHL